MEKIVGEVKKLLEHVSKSKTVIEKERDKLREVYGELEDLLASVEDAHGYFASGLLDIENGLDEISKHV